MRLYGMFDREARQVINIFASVNDDTAKRSFLSLLSSPTESIYSNYPQHFSLYSFGEISVDEKLSVPTFSSSDITCIVDTVNLSEIESFRSVLRERYSN